MLALTQQAPRGAQRLGFCDAQSEAGATEPGKTFQSEDFNDLSMISMISIGFVFKDSNDLSSMICVNDFNWITV